jgi:hypothetical protein
MDILSLTDKYIKFDNQLDIFNILSPNFVFRGDITLNEFTVSSDNEMRIDLIFQSMYDLEPNFTFLLEDVDVILFINNISNPINIKSGMTLLYPSLEDIGKFRLEVSSLNEDRLSVKEKIIVPNKSTKKDKDREKFKEDGFSLPPVVLETPRPPVRIENGKFSVGGL